MSDPVNHPHHYVSHPSGIECIQITEHMGFNLGNAIKYVWRADLKGDALEDLRKARWYLDREIARLGQPREPQTYSLGDLEKIRDRLAGYPGPTKDGQSWDNAGSEWLDTPFGWWCPEHDVQWAPTHEDPGMPWEDVVSGFGPMTDHQQSCGRGVCGGMLGHSGSCGDTLK